MVSFDFLGDTQYALFHSPANKVDEHMDVTFTGQNSFPIVPQDDDIEVNVQFLASPKTAVSEPDDLFDKNMDVNRIQIIKVCTSSPVHHDEQELTYLASTQAEKTPDSFEGADTMTFFAFVEDTSTKGTAAGSYDDA